MAQAAREPTWDWAEDLPGQWRSDANDDHLRNRHQSTDQAQPNNDSVEQQTHQTPPKRERFYRPRTCRICLEAVPPTVEEPSANLPGVFQTTPSVTYSSPEGGRLIRPCLCKGSQKYVHEGCLTAWRLMDPHAKRNYWQCPTCRYKYRLERMNWANWIGSTTVQVGLTVAIMILATFILGYVADPIINLYLDPYGTILSVPDGGPEPIHVVIDEDDYDEYTWAEHFLKGLASMGLLGFAKFFLTLSPWHWFNLRGTFGGGGGRAPGATGRERMQQLNGIAVIVGILTFLWAVWKGVRAWSRRTLTKASERVMDVPQAKDEHDDDDDDDVHDRDQAAPDQAAPDQAG